MADGKEDTVDTQQTCDRLKLSRRAHRSRFTTIVNEIDKIVRKCENADIVLDDVDQMDYLIENLCAKFENLQTLDSQIMDLTPMEQLETVIMEIDERADADRMQINKFKVKVQRFHSSIASPDQTNGRNSSPPSRSSSNVTAKLPKLSLPTFSGDLLQWQTFIDSFNSAVDTNRSLDNIQKFQYLRAQLTDEASRTIQGLTLTGDNYSQALQLLKDRYAKPHKLINSYMCALWDIPKPRNTTDSLRRYIDTIDNYIRGLEALGKNQDTYGELLVPMILDKLPPEFRINITRSRGNTDWTLEDLRKSILCEIEINSSLSATESNVTSFTPTAAFHTGARSKYNTGRFPRPQSNIRPNHHNAGRFPRPQHVQQTSSTKCIYCHGTHSANSCRNVTSVEARINIVKNRQLCFNCLGHHQVADCNSRYTCTHCKNRHHTSICNATHQNPDTTSARENNTPQSAQSENSPSATQSVKSTNVGHTSVNMSPAHSRVLLKTAVALVGDTQNVGCVRANILFDEGAQRSFIANSLALKLGLKSTTIENIDISTFDSSEYKSHALPFTNISVFNSNNESTDIGVLVVPSITSPINNVLDSSVLKLPHLQGLQLANPISTEAFQVDLLIGADYFWQFIGDTVIRGNGPTAVSSKLGFLLSGPTTIPYDSCVSAMLNIATLTRAPPMSEYWDRENAGCDNNDSSVKFEEYRDNCITFENDKYTAKLPWKDEHPPLPSNYDICAKRTRTMVKRLNSDMLHCYDDIIQDQLTRGFIEQVNDDEPTAGHYITHHPVAKDSSTTPIRIVYDCSFKQSRFHPSLNDCLETGPSLLNDILTILLRFRVHNVALSSDIEKAFLNVCLDKSDTKFTKFMWLSDPSDPTSAFNIYQFKVVLFGAVCSPFILNAVVKSHLEKQNSEVAADALRNIYVDNIITGASNISIAIDYYDEINEIFKRGGFKLRTWNSNNRELREKAQIDNIASSSNIESVLGYKWFVETDKIGYAVKAPQTLAVLTKRDIVRIVSEIFDPLGYITPVTIKGKLIIQELWKEKVDWDTPLSESTVLKWNNIHSEISLLENVKFARQYDIQDSSETSSTLHAFADSSLQAYGSAVYLQSGSTSSLVFAKSRVAPLKCHTIPRLELMAAVIAIRVLQLVYNAFKKSVVIKNIVIWTDSQVVYHWVKNVHNKKLPTFVQNRVNEINDFMLKYNCEVRYCPSGDNPADLLTRGINYEEYVDNELWWKGPKWLNTGSWPDLPLSDKSTLELEGEETISVNQTLCCSSDSIFNVVDITKFNKLQKLVNVVKYVLKFVIKCRPSFKSNLHLEETTNDAIDYGAISEHYVIKCAQKEVFHREIKYLRNKKKPIGPLVKQMKLYLDENGLLRCGGRIHNACINEETKFPILLPRHHPFTTLVINSAHETMMHSGVHSTFSCIRQKFWILKMRQAVKSVLRKCVTCQRAIGKPYQAPIQAPLPTYRINKTDPFEVTGVDFTGAINVMLCGREVKAYICLFTCAVTRAVHIEVVSDMSSETFIRCFRKFASRRSLPRLLISDNATTFLSSSKEIESLMTSSKVNNFLANKSVEWRFIPKRAPWFGGFWERLIGLMKNTMKKVLWKNRVTYDELVTIASEIECVLNDRPLTVVSNNPSDPEPLTPSHLLYGRRITSLPHSSYDTDIVSDPSYGCSSVQNHANRLANILSQFWRRWMSEYLPALTLQHNLTKGTLENRIQVGDVVLVHADNIPRPNWDLAVVVSLNVGKDGLARSAQIRTKYGQTNRPITKLYPLELNCVSEKSSDKIHDNTISDNTNIRSLRNAALKARDRIKDILDNE